MCIEKLEKEMSYCTYWYKLDFIKVLLHYNKDIDEQTFKKIIYDASIAGELQRLQEQFNGCTEPVERNTRYTKTSLIAWAKHLGFKIGTTFSTTNENDSDKINPTERDAMQKIMLGMAMSKYDFDPKSSRNKATGGNKDSIKSDLEKLGITVDEDTIRKHLHEASTKFL